ncbi:hypothetical protein CcI49_20520 [Frankia sp. CcI49]|uniref:hypothetical protein n=1 Tax=unclassified Frankia TaxID=2632575 RepID=UPI0006C9FD19|nr:MULTISPECIES: hypothetical protein [unclassified Frankia]KPM53114.1 hypothetical protein ACG83_27440 [Frankia sp. R43]ONH58694.1 hypothetical protein CcI49_20520 [Frankia sp. CcI49]
MYVTLPPGAALARPGLGPVHPFQAGAGDAAVPITHQASTDHATAVLDLLSGLLTGVVGLGFLLYACTGLLGVLVALLLRVGRRPSRPGPDAAA